MALNMEQEVAVLRRMTPRELRAKYEEVFGEECRSNHKQWLIKRIAWRLQANQEGNLSERARRRALELANDADLRLKPPQGHALAQPRTNKLPAPRDSRLPLPGTEISRVYKGAQLRVKALDDGFEFEGEIYKSLSAVAKAITGSHTSGYLFFGLAGKGGVQ